MGAIIFSTRYNSTTPLNSLNIISGIYQRSAIYNSLLCIILSCIAHLPFVIYIVVYITITLLNVQILRSDHAYDLRHYYKHIQRVSLSNIFDKSPLNQLRISTFDQHRDHLVLNCPCEAIFIEPSDFSVNWTFWAKSCTFPQWKNELNFMQLDSSVDSNDASISTI